MKKDKSIKNYRSTLKSGEIPKNKNFNFNRLATQFKLFFKVENQGGIL